jgi:glycerophosphoryl diester phosphodiesterase
VARLEARAVLPARTFSPGPPSGARLAGVAGAPWASQPVQGFSGLLVLPDGGFLTVTDNGYGVPENSSDFELRVYALAADFEKGTLAATPVMTLRDPAMQLPFPIVRTFSTERVLTGADLDVESLVVAPDGTYWFGDEFGPFLIHTDATGVVLEPPYEVPDGEGFLASPDSPFRAENLMLRSMEALRADALAHDAGTPACSPDEKLLTSAEQVAQLHRAGFKVVPWTVNEPARMHELVTWGVDGLITDRPDLARDQGFNPGLDVQGHRGARGLAPENTLPAFEAGLAAGASTLELDVVAAGDGAVVWHDPVAVGPKCRGAPASGLALAKAQTAQVQALVCDGTLAEFPAQSTKRDAPAALQVARSRGLASPFSLVPLDAVLDLPEATMLSALKKASPRDPLTGIEEPAHPLDWKPLEKRDAGRPTALDLKANRSLVRFNVETKLGASGAEHDTPEWLTRSIARTVEARGLTSRTTLQSFDWRSLRVAFAEFPRLGTVALFGKSPQAEAARAGLPWPERKGVTAKAKKSGGFESVALTPDGKRLLAVLEKPLAEDARREVVAYGFDLGTKKFTGVAFRLPLAPGGSSVCDFAFTDATHGYALERDDGDGAEAKHKRLVRVTLPREPGGVAAREDAADLLKLTSARGPFSFPFVTPEGVAPLPGGRVAIVNDNNFPFGHARQLPGGEPDPTELIIVVPRTP